MTIVSPFTIFLIGVATAVLLAIFVYASIRGLSKSSVVELPTPEQFEEQFAHAEADPHRPLKVILAIDGSPASLAAVGELGSCPLPPGSAIKVLTVLHTAVPAVPNFPPWDFSILATHGELLRRQERQAPALLEAAVHHLQPGRRQLDVTSQAVEGVPKDVILHEASEWGADRIVLGSHGYGKARRALIGSTAAAVAAEASCSVYIVRPGPDAVEERPSDTAS
ncbi:MAG: universal stress protein [Vicinamibacterales bacterium]